MHGHPWVATKTDDYGGAIEETCGCSCGAYRWRGLSPSDPSVTQPDGNCAKQEWRDGMRPDPCDVTSLA